MIQAQNILGCVGSSMGDIAKYSSASEASILELSLRAQPPLGQLSFWILVMSAAGY